MFSGLWRFSNTLKSSESWGASIIKDPQASQAFKTIHACQAT